MMGNFQELHGKRLQFLKKLYEVTEADESVEIDPSLLKAELGFSDAELDRISDYLQAEELIEVVNILDFIRITHKGIVKVENELSKENNVREINPIKSSSDNQPLQVFLCHSSSDKPKIRELYQRLRNDGLSPWLDEENLLPGADWRIEIQKAVEKSDVVIVCLSKDSITKAGYVQKEIKQALDVADEQPEGTIFIIPLKLEECDVPKRLSRWQWVDLFTDNGYQRLLRSLNILAEEKKKGESA